MSENPDVNELTDSFKLIVEQEVATPTVQLQWCVEPELVNFLSEKEIDNAQLLIIKHPRDERKEDREIVPLDKMMHYLQLNSAGDVNIMATVVWPQHQSDIEDIEDTLLEQDPYGGYENSIIDRDGGLYDSSSFSELEINQFVSERTLSVPSELFASEPPEWEQQWVNAMFENPPMDQC